MTPSWLDLSAVAVDITPLRRYRQFRLLFTGRVVSVFGLGMLMVILSIQTYEITGSSIQVALVNSALGVATVVGGLAGGVLADRCDRRSVILLSRGLAIAGFAGLAVASTWSDPHVAVLYTFAVWDGLTGAAGATAFGAAVPSVVPEDDLPSTGALMAVSLDLGMIAAPLLAGVVSGRWGPSGVYWLVVAISAISWLFLFRLAPMRASEEGSDPGHDRDEGGQAPRAESRWSWVVDLFEGFAFARKERIVGAVLLMGFLQILLASPHVLVPEFVGQILQGGPEGVGLVYSATSIGAILATICSGWVARVRRAGVVIVIIYMLGGIGVAAFGVAPTVGVAAGAMALVGAADAIGEILRFTILAEQTPDRMRGRVQSLWSSQTTVGDTLGGPILSLLARAVGVAPAIALGGVTAAALTASLLALRPLREHVRRVPDAEEPSASEPVPEDLPDLIHPHDPGGEAANDITDRRAP